jgi:hypothetical protein
MGTYQDIAALRNELNAYNMDVPVDDPTLPVRLLLTIGDAYRSQGQEELALSAYEEALLLPDWPEEWPTAQSSEPLIERALGE